MYYDKRIRYIDYLENGEKKRNCGYVKATVTGGRLLLEVRIRDLYETDDVASEVALEGGGTESRIGTVQIKQGCGSFRWEYLDPEQEGDGIALGAGMRYGQLERIQVQLSPRRSLRCIWRAAETAGENGTSAQAAYAPKENGQSAQSDDVPALSIDGDSARCEPYLESAQGGIPGEAVYFEPQPEQAAGERVRPEPQSVPRPKDPARETVHSVSQPEIWPESVSGETLGSGLRLISQAQDAVGISAFPELQPGSPTDNHQGDAMDPAIDAAEIGKIPPQKPQPENTDPADMGESADPADMRESADSADMGERAEPQRTRQTPRMASMSEDKWRQLQKIHPHIRPFQDEREYLSLRPEDFVILSSGSYRLVQNSFLLHGYFNYEHLILTRVQQKSGDQYYIGVPGNFFEKEKQVAIMYGFESFECRREPASEGEFGYYMIRVDL